MSKLLRSFLILFFIWSAYHLIRDVATEFFQVSHPLIDIGHRTHIWCQPICGVITIPLEMFAIVAIPFVLKRNNLGILGKTVIATIPLWLFAWLAP